MSLEYQRQYYKQLFSDFKLAKSVEEKDDLRRFMSSTEAYVGSFYGVKEVNKMRAEVGLEPYKL